MALGRSTTAREVSCSASAVQYSAGGRGGLSTIPWMKVGARGRAYLFLYGPELADGRVNQSSGVVIYTGGGTDAFSTKVLWAPAHSGSRATLSGTRLDAAGSFAERLSRAGDGAFPSIVSIPEAGCWKLTLRTGGRRSSVVVRAVDPPATVSCDSTPVRRDSPDPGGGQLPWIAATPASAGITGAIFYRLPDDRPGAVIYPNERAPDNASTKILWTVRRSAAGRTLALSARRLDAPGLSPRQLFPPANDSSPGASFPSIVNVASTGCWLLTIRSGKAGAIAVFESIAAP